MTAPLPALPEFPRPPEFPAARNATDTLADFLSDLFSAGVASVVDPLPLAGGQSWREWAQSQLQSSGKAGATAAPSIQAGKSGATPGPGAAASEGSATAAASAAKKSRPALAGLLEAAHRRLLLELPVAPPGTEPLRLDPIVAVEAARRLYQICQALAAPQQEKEPLRRSFAGDFRPRSFAGILSTYATWRYLPMAWEHVRQRLTVSSGATPAMQEAERLIREQLAFWPLPLPAVLAIDIAPDPAALELLDSHPVGVRYLAEQLLQRALSAPDARLDAWVTERLLEAMDGLLGGVPPVPGCQRLRTALGEKGHALVDRWEDLLARSADTKDLPPTPA